MSARLDFEVRGRPAPKGSLRHVGNGRLVEQVKGSAPWRAEVARAAAQAATWQGWTTLTGPVEVIACVQVPHLKTPRTWPITRSSGDLDKHARNLLDAIVDAGLIVDDSQVVALHLTKRYWSTPGATVSVREAREATD